MTRHCFGFSILILFLALAQISALEPNWQHAEPRPVLTVVPHVLSDGYTTNLTLMPSVNEFTGETNTSLACFGLLENNIVYLLVAEVGKNLAGEIQSAQSSLATNKIAGTILDLRFAAGDNAAAAKAAANLFAAKKLPLAILVNGKTQGAAATLATTLRAARDGLVFGSATADLKPDIAVTVNAEDESAFFKNPYAALAQSTTNSASATNSFSPFIDHTSEADLVRARIKDGDQDEDSLPARPAEPQKPFIHDPVLARAVDLLKALAVVQPSRS